MIPEIVMVVAIFSFMWLMVCFEHLRVRTYGNLRYGEVFFNWKGEDQLLLWSQAEMCGTSWHFCLNLYRR